MRIRAKKEEKLEADMTPMIDMTFQLIAFFMILINFNETEQHRKVVLPRSELAKPRDEKLEPPLIIHLTREGRAIWRGQEVEVEQVGQLLADYKGLREGVTDKAIVIRGHEKANTGKVQELIEVCQNQGFEKFALRAEQKVVR